MEDTNHIIIPNDAKLVGPVKASWTKTRVAFTFKKNFLKKDILNILDSDTIRVLIKKNGLLSSEEYLLVVPSSFKTRQSDWEIIESKIRISAESVKISIPIPENFNSRLKKFYLGDFQKESFFVITKDGLK